MDPSGDQFLAGAALARNQDRAVHAGDRAGDGDGLVQGRTVPGKPTESASLGVAGLVYEIRSHRRQNRQADPVASAGTPAP